mgnify:CR=1 FL=1|jgi:hypothetical protein
MKDKLGLVLFELALVGALWWYFKFVPALGFTLVGAVLLSGLAPERFARLASGLALLGVAALFYFYGYRQLAMILGGFGLILAIIGATSLASGRRAPQNRT